MRGVNFRRPGSRWHLVLWSSAALVPVLALLAITAREDRWRGVLGTIAFVQLYLVIASWVWIEGGWKPRCRRNHLVERGRWRCSDSHGTEFRGTLLAAALLALGCVALVPSQGWIGAFGLYGIFPLAAFILAAGYRPPSRHPSR